MAEAFTRQMEKAHVQYQDLLKETHAAALPTTLKVTSSTDGFRVMDPFDWTLDKNVYQRWQLWSHKARLALEAMEGDTEKTKISYLHHWLNGIGISKIEGWKNSNTLISQEDYDKLTNKTGKYSLDKIESYFILCELALIPRSNVRNGGQTNRFANCRRFSYYCFRCIVDFVVLLFYWVCVDRSGSLSGGAFNQLKLVTLNIVLTILYSLKPVSQRSLLLCLNSSISSTKSSNIYSRCPHCNIK